MDMAVRSPQISMPRGLTVLVFLDLEGALHVARARSKRHLDSKEMDTGSGASIGPVQRQASNGYHMGL
jgi:hypothetical protein